MTARLLLSLLMLLGLAAEPARAAAVTTTLTFSGVISAGRDSAGYFGPWGANLAGRAFQASYTFTTLASSSVGLGIDSLATSDPLATTMIFSITVNGRTRSSTATTGTAASYDGVGGLFTGGFDSVSATALNNTASGGVARTFEMNAMVLSANHNMLTDTRSLNAMPSTTYTVAADDQASGQFAFRQSPGSPSVLSYGILAIHQLSVLSTPEIPITAAVPEPGEWAMISAGLGIVAFSARRRRRF